MKKYSVADIDDLRRTVEQIYLWGNTILTAGASVSRCYRPEEKETAVEERVRTYMLAGITGQDLRNRDAIPSSQAT